MKQAASVPRPTKQLVIKRVRTQGEGQWIIQVPDGGTVAELKAALAAIGGPPARSSSLVYSMWRGGCPCDRRDQRTCVSYMCMCLSVCVCVCVRVAWMCPTDGQLLQDTWTTEAIPHGGTIMVFEKKGPPVPPRRRGVPSTGERVSTGTPTASVNEQLAKEALAEEVGECPICLVRSHTMRRDSVVLCNRDRVPLAGCILDCQPSLTNHLPPLVPQHLPPGMVRHSKPCL